MGKHSDLKQDDNAIDRVVRGYYAAFSRDPATASTFYGEPAIFISEQGLNVLMKRADVEARLAKVLSELKRLGYSYSKLADPRIKMLNAATALYSVVAVRCKEDGGELQRAGFTYLLHRNPDWRIYELIATDPDKLVAAS
jgi:hypothetical protein